jgi:hypothetical protein
MRAPSQPPELTPKTKRPPGFAWGGQPAGAADRVDGVKQRRCPDTGYVQVNLGRVKVLQLRLADRPVIGLAGQRTTRTARRIVRGWRLAARRRVLAVRPGPCRRKRLDRRRRRRLPAALLAYRLERACL